MLNIKDASIRLDLDQFKLHLPLPGQQALSLHFDTPSRRFYLSVIALVVEEMKKNGRMGFVLLEDHADVLALLNETVGGSAGSSKKRKLLPRIYRKWKGALPDLENAPLFKVIGRKKGYDDASGKAYRFDEKATDAWANLFEYKGSGEKVRLRFSVERLGVELNDVTILYGNPSDKDEGGTWERFIDRIRRDVKLQVAEKEHKRDAATKPALKVSPEDQEPTPSSPRVLPEGISWESFKDWLEKQGGIEKIPLTTRLEIIARLAMAPGAAPEPGVPHEGLKSSKLFPNRLKSPDSSAEHPTISRISLPANAEIPERLMAGISTSGSSAMLYMAPELKEGQPPSPRSEVYALGVLLYQLVVGDLSSPLDPDWEEAVSDDILREDIAACVAPLPEKRLAHPMELSERLRTQNERRSLLLVKNLPTIKAQDALPRPQHSGRWIAWGSVFAIILVLLAVFMVYHYRVSQAEAAKKQAYKINLPKIRQLLEDEKYVDAHALGKETEKVIPDDPTLTKYIEDATNTLDIETMPTGAKVSYRPYADLKGPWTDLGITPIRKVSVPVGMHRFRIQKEGYQERDLVSAVVPRDSLSPELENFLNPLFGKPYQFDLYEKNSVPDGMLAVDHGRFVVALKGLPVITTGMVLDRFLIDETEVTNRAYKDFVDAGGYSNPAYWIQEFRRDGQAIPWAKAVKEFVDRTGHPGPSTWELGDYPERQDDYPVSGVSWYEAAAYAEFRGKSLPTIYHWARAAFPIREISTPLTPYIIPQSNIEGSGIAAVGSFPGIGSSGAKDMAGNVREWCWNAVGESRYCLGGTWKDPAYMFNESCAPSAWDRSLSNGFRCAVYPEDAPVADKYMKEIDLAFYDPYSIPPLSKEAFEAIKAMFGYKRSPLNPVLESRKKEGRGWTRETVTIDAAYNKERLIIHLDLPTTCKPPYKTVIYFPGGNALYQPEFSRNFLWEPWDLIPKNGRALISPIYSCTFERGGGEAGLSEKKSSIQRFSEWVKDLGRTIDYLETRGDIDTKNIAFIGVSMGALLGPILAPFEERIRSLILVSGCIYLPVDRPKPKGLVQPLVNVPVLMLSGKYDYTWPVKTHQKPLFDLLGTPPEHKKHVIYESGHLPLPRAPMMKEIFASLDKYQGPVDCGGTAKTGEPVVQ